MGRKRPEINNGRRHMLLKLGILLNAMSEITIHIPVHRLKFNDISGQQRTCQKCSAAGQRSCPVSATCVFFDYLFSDIEVRLA